MFVFVDIYLHNENIGTIGKRDGIGLIKIMYVFINGGFPKIQERWKFPIIGINSVPALYLTSKLVWTSWRNVSNMKNNCQ